MMTSSSSLPRGGVVVFVLPSDRGHFNYAKDVAERLSLSHAIEIWAPASASSYAPSCASFHPLTDAEDVRFDRMTRVNCALWAHGSDPDPQKACDEANKWHAENLQTAYLSEFEEEFEAKGENLSGLQGPRETLIALKERVLRSDVVLCVYDAVHVYQWIGDHAREYGVPTLGLKPSIYLLWRPDDPAGGAFLPDNLGEEVEPKYSETEGLRKNRDKAPHAVCYTAFPPLLPCGEDATPGIVTGPVFPPTESGVPRDQEAAFASSELRAWLEADERPVLLVCFGSMLKGAPILAQVCQKFMRETVDGTKHRTLYVGWNPMDSGGSDEKDVRYERWIPQAAVLAHPRVRAFVSHCGATSVNEAIYHKVPIIALPFFHDQRFLGRKAADIGAATACLMKDTFEPKEGRAAIAEALTSARVRETLSDLSDQIKACRGLERIVQLAERLIEDDFINQLTSRFS